MQKEWKPRMARDAHWIRLYKANCRFLVREMNNLNLCMSTPKINNNDSNDGSSQMKKERYSRFTLQPAEDEERHVEVKLSDDATDASTEAEGQPGGSPSFRPAPLQQSRRNVCYSALAILLIFVIGYLVGFISHRKPQAPKDNCLMLPKMEDQQEETPAVAAPAPAPAPAAQLDWKDITELLSQKLTSQACERTLRNFDQPGRSAGSDEDKNLANRLFDEFRKLKMDRWTWTDIHYVQLQTAETDIFEPAGYLAYSPPGKVEGKLVYGNYGRRQDLDAVQKKNVELKGSVLLLRAGKISFAEQVDNAATRGASAVLIYPDIKDYKYLADTPLYGQVHLGSGDPYTPGFPSFNNTQFPPTQSSGLPKIPAQTITANMATALLRKIGGPQSDPGFRGGFTDLAYGLGGSENITVEIASRHTGSSERDAWGRGYAKATVGTSVLIELAKAIQEMVEKDGFRPRRSLVFASWSAGEYGSVGATEWLEAYMASVDKRAFTYISLDGVIMGRGSFIASASPLLYSLLESTMKEVKSPLDSGTVYDMVGQSKWKATVLRPMSLDDPAYPFLASSGIPSISFHFITPNTETYTYYGTNLDNMDHLNYATNQSTSEMTAVAAQFAGQMALRLAHNHLLSLDVSRYSSVITEAVSQVYKRINQLLKSGELKDLNPNWLSRARGSFQRAADSIKIAAANMDSNDKEACRILNDRIMRIEHALLSPYISPAEVPFRHLLLGRGSHTLASIAETTDMKELRTQLALATWSLQGCANAMVGDIWDLDEEI
ncbi:hypothetical protein L3Q82_004677 [Scortum barcoo]|uniref:Uncharacterized protein n=1 Tax=Scortum barcoo TaxID=214431 RepID=A0ACB8VHI4_9TELE|nr:hypothetical protein L3Q82_004677 [Scortum barcoo]